jgi:hypothetical protein
MIRSVYWSLCKVVVVLLTFKLNSNFSKNTQTSNFMKIRPVGAELFHAVGCTDGQTDRRDEANSHFRSIAKALKITCV